MLHHKIGKRKGRRKNELKELREGVWSKGKKRKKDIQMILYEGLGA